MTNPDGAPDPARLSLGALINCQEGTSTSALLGEAVLHVSNAGERQMEFKAPNGAIVIVLEGFANVVFGSNGRILFEGENIFIQPVATYTVQTVGLVKLLLVTIRDLPRRDVE